MNNMKIAFFGHINFIDFFQIGGFESFVRRVAMGLTNWGNEVDYILFDSPSEKYIKVSPNLTVNYFRTFEEASRRLLAGNYDHVFKGYLPRLDRLKYLLLPGTKDSKTRWHTLVLAWPDSLVKRALVGLEGRCNSPNGLMVCASPRQYLALARFFRSARHIFPPVPEEYFVRPEDKKTDGKINVTFLGILSKDKFGEEIINLFKNLQGSSKLRFSIYASHDHLNSYSVNLHKWLQSQHEIKYVSVDRQSYSPDTDKLVKTVLQDTDVFVQPYRRLVNTLDMPLLVLEAMASLCPVITTPVGSVPQVYGKSKFIIALPNFLIQAENLLRNLTFEQIIVERKRIFERNRQLNFNMASIVEKYLALLR
jgi:glycosyltransferase involved in cell wall biosynthesis